jgi:hypothetical protein
LSTPFFLIPARSLASSLVPESFSLTLDWGITIVIGVVGVVVVVGGTVVGAVVAGNVVDASNVVVGWFVGDVVVGTVVATVDVVACDPTCKDIGTSAVAPPVPVRVIKATAPATPKSDADHIPQRE